ncbi:hypothetical protein GRS66_010899 [Saccharomyces pastorianus]|uniref:Zn(2)-C6 fungal-type domain-containing protein n=1 Tax=Saccharomyces pastorianus TaxID=27292 RepID=A0A6C1EHG5_SACPS|nr:hypothetical protein GRS66_010899 [Saccharomyces pastorianus]
MVNDKSARRPRPSFVCIPCKSRKLKCDRLRPVCRKTSKQCAYENEPNLSKTPCFTVELSDEGRNCPSQTIRDPTQDIYTPTSIARSNDVSETPISNSISCSFVEKTSKDMELKLWHPKDMLVNSGGVTFFDAPFASHTLIELDPFLRALTVSIHGTTLVDLQNNLLLCSNEEVSFSNYLDKINGEKGEAPQQILSPLTFIDKAIVKWVDNATENGKNTFSFNFFHSAVLIFCNSNIKVLHSLQPVITEASSLLPDKKIVDLLLKVFYENVYPFYPYLDIRTFEEELQKILISSYDGRYEISVTKDSLSNLYVLSLFLLIMANALRSIYCDRENYPQIKLNVLEAAKQYCDTAQKLLHLLNGYKNTNEKSFCCLLYFYILVYLNPTASETLNSYTNLLNIKCLSELALTLGLHQEPSKISRYIKEIDPDPDLLNFRRKLWVGLQSLKFMISIPEGVSNKLENEYLSNFLGTDEDMVKIFEKNFHELPGYDVSLLNDIEDKYEFHKILNCLISSATPINGNPNLLPITENLKRTREYIDLNFSSKQLSNTGVYGLLNVKQVFCREAVIEVESIRKTAIFMNRIVGLLCILNINNVLAVHFEKEAKIDWTKNQDYYHLFFLDCLTTYTELFRDIVSYLKGDYKWCIPKKYSYSINKLICFSLMRLWVFQTSLCLRFSYKQLLREKGSQSVEISNEFNDMYGNNFDLALQKSLKYMRYHLKLTLDLASKELMESDSECFVSLSMFKYIAYLLDTGNLATSINVFWERSFNTNEVSKTILKQVNMKWGINMTSPQYVKRHLMNSQALSSLTYPFLKNINIILESSVDPDNTEDIDAPSEAFSIDTGEQLSMRQTMKENYDLFADLINSNLGEIPTL